MAKLDHLIATSVDRNVFADQLSTAGKRQVHERQGGEGDCSRRCLTTAPVYHRLRWTPPFVVCHKSEHRKGYRTARADDVQILLHRRRVSDLKLILPALSLPNSHHPMAGLNSTNLSPSP